jgi:CheY-like chemotaxis protein
MGSAVQWRASMKILIVDDDPDTITFLSAWLEDHGYDTCSASDGERGLKSIASESPDLILLDVRMPNQTGLQLYRDIKLNKQWGDIPVIFISGVDEPQYFDKGSEPLPLPAAFISKPIDFKMLQNAIKRALT